MSSPPDSTLLRDAARPTWAEIDLRAFDRNLAALRGLLPEGTRLMAVLKADGYGHGAIALARRCESAGIAMIGVALLQEALDLRGAGITIPILVLGAMDEAQFRVALDHDLTPGVPGPEELAVAARIASERDIHIHLKLDSGMGRMGVVPGELQQVVQLIRSAPRLRIDAFYSHFANADDPGDPFTERQIEQFAEMREILRAAGISAPAHHLANSAATMRGIPSGAFARTGIALYGAEPLSGSRLEPVMRWRTVIARLKELPAGHAIGYGTTFRTGRPSRIATLPVGYADGYRRGLSNRGEVLVRGRRAPIVGRVSMDLITVDVTDIEEATVGDEVILLGRQGSDEITVEELAAKLDTIAYEVFCGVSARVPRLYRDGDTVTRSRTRIDA